jgi:pyruvate dehydrogenase E2 component (dihydrolipoamide acetyltransferase)
MAEFRMPALGADMDEGTLVEWLVKPGDEIHKGDIIAVVDTDKSAIEVESFHSGTVSELIVPVGRTVPVGTVLATIEALAPPQARPEKPRPGKPRPGKVAAKRGAVGKPTPGKPSAAPSRPERVQRPATATATGPPEQARPASPLQPTTSPLVRQLAEELGVDVTRLHGTGHGGVVTRADVEMAARPVRPRVTPLARRIAAELGLDLGAIAGTGPGGAVREADVLRAASEIGARQPAAAEPAAAGPAAARPAAIAEQSRARRQAIARLMARSKREIPHYYIANTVDMANAMTWLRERNRAVAMSDRIVPAALLLKAAAVAARKVPELNGFWVDDQFAAAGAVHVGVAISLRDGGLLTPAIHDAADLPVGDLMARLRDLVARARTGRLRSSELTDATITVTNLGDQGVESVHGVIYPPQVALVGFGKIVERPWAVGTLIGVRPVVVTTLAGDHRATDGYTGARYLAEISALLQRPEEM